MNNQNLELKQVIDNAILKFNNKEKYLLENDLSERCICSRFAYYIQSELCSKEKYEDYVVDVEYNRGNVGNERSVKRLNDKNIIVDLIVHKRGYNNDFGFDNLICIEMKKSNDSRGQQGLKDDENRLKDMTSYRYGFIYKIGFMIIADMKTYQLYIKKQFLLS